MSSSAVLTGVRRLRSLLAARQGCEQSDEQLLAAFADRRDEIAFATLVRRHGPMVLGVCRRVLGHVQDAEDAYQATFLVLAQRAAELRDKTALASFLHGAAYRLASKIKRAAGRRRKYEGRALARSPIDPADELLWREVRELLDEEIARLPEKYRSVFVLCCLENLSRAEAGQCLGLKERTVLSRMAEARKRLSQRLARRGVELTAALAVIGLATPLASAVPAELMASTIKATLATAAGEKLADAVSETVAELVKSMTAAMMASKVKMATLVVLAASLLTAAASGSFVFLYGRASGPLAATTELPAAKADDRPKVASTKPEAAKTLDIQGRVVDPEGKPVSGAKLFEMRRTTAASSFCPDARLDAVGTTDAEGRFRVIVRRPDSDVQTYLFGHAAGFGVDWVDLSEGKRRAEVMLRLPQDVPIAGRIVNTEGRPVAGASVSIARIYVPTIEKLDDYLKGGPDLFFDKLGNRTPKQLRVPLDGIISGRVVDKQTGKGVQSLIEFEPLAGNSFYGSKPGFDKSGYDPEPTDKDGHFRRVTIPGKLLVLFQIQATEKLNGQDLCVYRQAVPDPDHKDIFIKKKISPLPDEDVWDVRLANNAVTLIPGGFNAVKVIDAKEEVETRVELSVERGATARIAVQDAE
jgi:RNA polymerase sigma factor (sigma-70 family)